MGEGRVQWGEVPGIGSMLHFWESLLLEMGSRLVLPGSTPFPSWAAAAAATLCPVLLSVPSF